MTERNSFDLHPMLVLAWCTFQGNLRSSRVWGLVVLASLPTLVVAGLLSYHITGTTLVSAYEGIQEAFLPLVLLIVTLLLAVPLLREEIDSQSISYLMTRTLGKPRTVAGKYLGGVLSGLAILLPPSLVGYGLVAAGSSGSTLSLDGVLASVVVILVLGVLAFGAFFLLLGVLFRRALIWGLLYAFFWEEFVGNLTGTAPELSITHYLLSIPTFWVSAGPLATYSTTLSLPVSFEVPVAFALVCLVVGWMALMWANLLPSPE